MKSLMNPAKPGGALLLLGLIQAFHSVEEIHFRLYDFAWTASGFIHRNFSFFPQFRMDPLLFFILNIIIVAAILALVPYLNRGRPWAVSLAWFWGLIESLNGGLHVAGTVVFSEYVPGALTAPVLSAAGILLILRLRRRRSQ